MGDIQNDKYANMRNLFCIFKCALAFNGDISSWDVYEVTNMECMFKMIVNSIDISSHGMCQMGFMFYGETEFIGRVKLSIWRPHSLVPAHSMEMSRGMCLQ